MAEIAIAELTLGYATVRAPFDGRIVSLQTSTGQFVSALNPVFMLIDTRRWFIGANFRETDLKGIRTGTPATVYMMGDSGRRFNGKVDSSSYGVAPDEAGIALPGGLPRIQRKLNGSVCRSASR